MLRLLELETLFEGVVYCDYCESAFPAKPQRLAYERAMACARVADPALCYFVDDSDNNVRVALECGWHAIHLDEEQESTGMIPTIRVLEELPLVFPELFDGAKRHRLAVGSAETGVPANTAYKGTSVHSVERNERVGRARLGD